MCVQRFGFRRLFCANLEKGACRFVSFFKALETLEKGHPSMNLASLRETFDDDGPPFAPSLLIGKEEALSLFLSKELKKKKAQFTERDTGAATSSKRRAVLNGTLRPNVGSNMYLLKFQEVVSNLHKVEISSEEKKPKGRYVSWKRHDGHLARVTCSRIRNESSDLETVEILFAKKERL